MFNGIVHNGVYKQMFDLGVVTLGFCSSRGICEDKKSNSK